MQFFKILKTAPTRISSLLPHLMHCVAFARRPRFCFTESLTIGFTMGRAKFRVIDIVVGFSRWSLWKVLTIFWRYMTVEKRSQVFFFLDNSSI